MSENMLAVKPVEDLLDLIIKSLGLNLVYRSVPDEQTLSGHLPKLRIELSGADAPLLTANNCELLHAIEHIAAKILNLESDQHDAISLDAESFKQDRDRNLQRSAEIAVTCVQQSGQPYTFPPMTSRERRMLHLALQDSGLSTASFGEPPRRSVVLYPNPPVALASAATPARTNSIRSSFRPR